MSEKEKSLARRFSKVFPILKRDDQKYILGIAEGMAMATAEGIRESITESTQRENKAQAAG